LKAHWGVRALHACVFSLPQGVLEPSRASDCTVDFRNLFFRPPETRRPYCIRDNRKLEHWGSGSCFLGPEDRRGAHFLFVNTHVGRLLRLESAAVDAAAKREGKGPWGTV